MDEPLSNLDAKLRQEMRREIRELQQRLGMTMIYVTHDQTEAMTMADKVILMKEGRIEQAGPPDELYRKPSTAYAGSFIGTPPMNILKFNESIVGSISGLESVGSINGQHRYLLGVRPEHVEIVETGLPAKVLSAEYLGAETLLVCEAANQPVVLTTPGKFEIGCNEIVHLAWKKSHTHLFEAESGWRTDKALTSLQSNRL
jgi:sn-glycerol 3-phosphate transport system ATP-binding protein